MKLIYWLSVAFLLCHNVLPCAACIPGAPRRPDISEAKRMVRSKIEEFPSLGPLFVRAVFHDCFAASRRRKASGCNGSLRGRQELDNFRNHGLERVIEIVQPISRDTCVSVADLIVYGSTAGLYKAGGPFVAPRFGRKDSPLDEPDDFSKIPTGEGEGKESADLIFSQFKGQGFDTAREVVASIVGGHAIGGRATLRRNPVTRQVEEHRISFTSSPQVFNAAYARHLVSIEKNRRRRTPGFNPLRSDIALLENPKLRTWIHFYANDTTICAGRSCGPSSILTVGDLRLYRDFGRFMKKLGQL